MIELIPRSTLLDNIVIEAPRIHKKVRLGWMGGKDGVLPLDTIQGGGAVAMLLEPPKTPCFVDRIQLRLMYNSKDTLAFRLHFYAYDSIHDQPGRELLSKEIILKEQKRYGWMSFDLKEYGIVIDEAKFFIGFEWIDQRNERLKMIDGLLDWQRWKENEFKNGNPKVELINTIDMDSIPVSYYKYNGNMMNWPGFKELPPFTGLMVETGKHKKTMGYRTFERKTSFGKWNELNSTLNTVLTVVY